MKNEEQEKCAGNDGIGGNDSRIGFEVMNSRERKVQQGDGDEDNRNDKQNECRYDTCQFLDSVEFYPFVLERQVLSDFCDNLSQ